jgi:cytochrome P450
MSYGSHTAARKAPPSGPALSPRAQALRWIGQPYEFLRECAAAYGETFTLDMGLEEGKYVVVSHPDAIRSILTAEVGALRVCNGVLAPLLGPSSVLLVDAERHLQERRLLVPAFQHRAVGIYGQIIHHALELMTKDWTEGLVVPLHDALQELSFDVILRVVFGDAGSEFRPELKRGVTEILNDRRLGLGILGRPGESGTMPALGAFWQKLEQVREVALRLVKRTRDECAEGTVMAALSRATDEDGRPLPDEHLRDEVLTLLVTGHETTTTAMIWGLYWIDRTPEVGRRLREELASLGSNADPLACAQLPYLDATCKEILRIYPIVPSLFRQVADRPFAAGGYLFEPGTFLSPSIYLAHHREETYAHPDRFEPARFMERTFSPYEYLPFGGGPRRCVGMHLAVFEMKVVLSTLLRRFEFELKATGRVNPTRRFVTVGPGDGLSLRVGRSRRAAWRSTAGR